MQIVLAAIFLNRSAVVCASKVRVSSVKIQICRCFIVNLNCRAFASRIHGNGNTVNENMRLDIF